LRIGKGSAVPISRQIADQIATLCASGGVQPGALLIEQIRTGDKPKQLFHRVPVEFVMRESIGRPRTMRGA
jgi:hypothetical protein